KGHSIRMSHSLINYWDIDTSRPLTITVGSNEVQAMIEEAAITKDEVFLDEGLYENLLLPTQEIQWIASFSYRENILKLGPILGLLTDWKETDDEPYFRSIHTFCGELHELISEIGGFFYVFQLSDFSDGKLFGSSYQED